MPGRSDSPRKTLVLIAAVTCAPLFAVIDGSHSEVSAETRLRDYLTASQYPPANQVLHPGYTALENIPLIPGDQSSAGKILGITREQVRGGSLLIFFKVRIDRAGSYSFRTLLLHHSQQGGAQAMTNALLKPGEHELAFSFYGKIIRDTLGKGPYLIPGILAEKLPDDGGEAGALGKFLKRHETRDYNLRQFTDKVWYSAEKRSRIRELQREISRNKK